MSFEHKYKTNDPNIILFSYDSLAAAAKTFQASLAVGFLLVPAFLLFLVPMSRAAMACVVLSFIFAFAGTLVRLSEAKPHELLIGTAA